MSLPRKGHLRCTCKVDKFKSMRALYAHLRSKNSAGSFHYHVWCALAERIANLFSMRK